MIAENTFTKEARNDLNKTNETKKRWTDKI